MNISKEDYIKAIYELGGYEKNISNKEIAEKLCISPPSVSEMVRKLVKDGDVKYREYVGVSLTEKGIEKGRNLRRRHLLWEVFLVEKLGYSWDEVHVEAEKLEHITNEKMEDRLSKYLNYPSSCPHGNPLVLDKNKYTSLEDFNKDFGIITRFRDIRELLVFARENQLEITSEIKVLSREKDGIRILVNKGENILVPKKFTKDIFIKEVDQ